MQARTTAFRLFALLACLLFYGQAAAQAKDYLQQNGYLKVGEYITSWSKKYYAVLQGDGNFCIYKGPGPSSSQGYVWCAMSKPHPNGAYVAQLREDGNFCVFADTAAMQRSSAIWCGAKAGLPKAQFIMVLGDDGNLQTWKGPNMSLNEGMVWQTNTAQMVPLGYSQEFCFESAGGFEARGYIWYAVGSASKSYDTKGMAALGSPQCHTLPQGAHSATIRMTINPGRLGSWPQACDVRMPVPPIAARGGTTVTSKIKVKAKGTIFDYWCEFCIDDNCKKNLPVPSKLNFY